MTGAAFRLLLISILLAPLWLGDQPGVWLGAQESPPPASPSPGGDLSVSLVTIGQGDLVWERFGHNALLFEDRADGTATAYHWGIFNFFSEDFIPRLIRGTMLYSMGPSDFAVALSEYRRAGRPVWIQELALTPDQRVELLALVEENYLPENRDYRYDYYRDNCSTRLRDALDGVIGGQIQALFANDTTEHSFRWHTRRILGEMPLYYLGIQFVLGPSADRPITVWEEMFLPRTLRENLREVQVPDGSGGFRPLVAREGELLEPTTAGPPSSPPFALPLFLALGLMWGGSLIWIGRPPARMSSWRRAGVFVLGGGWAGLASLGGTLLLGAWLFTDHEFWYANFNLFQVSPLFLPLLLALFIFLVKNRLPAWGRRTALALAGLSVLGVIVEALPGIGQNNLEILALTVPLNLALWIAAGRLKSG
ncbi:MAG: DUF4105 domain-containing protein [Gemmatimonadetes bacterium]|nr:DUF4105 domain-containing protein [Gemmatimonadota bacterium]NNM05218.1 DUF4105 domain-containing protein [Gemmatimonadota bacterium]